MDGLPERECERDERVRSRIPEDVGIPSYAAATHPGKFAIVRVFFFLFHTELD